jgi:hypothetical protein
MNAPAGNTLMGRSREPAVVIAIACTVYAALSMTCAYLSKGFLEIDGITHYLYARWATHNPAYFVDMWGRPFRTTLYSLPAKFGGLIGVRWTSCALALCVAWVSYLIARDLKLRWPGLAAIALLSQPLTFLHSMSELTELPFALLVGLAFWAYVRRRWLMFALVCSLLPTSRPEGFALLPVIAVVLALHRCWYYVPLLAVPLLVWNHVGWLTYGKPPGYWHWLISKWPYQGGSAYEPGPLLKYLGVLPWIIGPLVLPAMFIGWVRSLLPVARLRTLKAALADHRERCLLLVGLIPLPVFVGYSLLHWLGKMSSSGEPRYLLIVAPLWAVLTAQGVTWLWQRYEWKHVYAAAAVLGFAWLLVNVHWRILPLSRGPDLDEAETLAAWHRAEMAAKYPNVFVAHPGVTMYMDRVPSDMSKQNVASRPAHTLLIWHKIYSLYNSDPTRIITPEFVAESGWHEIPRPAGVGEDWRFYTSE